MQPQTTFFGTPADLEAALLRVIQPLAEEVQDLKAKLRQQHSILSVKQVADDCGRSSETVLDWIKRGKTPPGKTKPVKLRVVDGLSDGPYLIRWDDYQSFLAHFPSIQITVKS